MGATGGGGVWGVGVVGRIGGVEVRAGGGRKGNMAGWLVGCWLVLRRGNAGVYRVPRTVDSYPIAIGMFACFHSQKKGKLHHRPSCEQIGYISSPPSPIIAPTTLSTCRPF